MQTQTNIPSSPEYQASPDLQDLWGNVLERLELCVMHLRSIPNCEKTVVTIAITNGNTTDVYSFPGTDTNGMFNFPVVGSKLNDASQVPKTAQLQLRTPTFPVYPNTDPLSLNTTEIAKKSNVQLFTRLEKLSARELKKLLSNVRTELGLRSFIWPEEATNAFKTIHPCTNPAAPGRSGATKFVMVDLLRLSALTNERWSSVIRKVLNASHGSCSERIRQGNLLKDKAQKEYHSNEGMESKRKAPELTQSVLNLPCVEEVLQVAKSLPKGLPEVHNPRKHWPNRQQLLCNVRYPSGQNITNWARQGVPGDGNCLFYSAMVASGSIGIISQDLNTAESLRRRMGFFLRQIAEAGSVGSCIRREWLISCIYDIEDESLSVPCHTLLENAARTAKKADIQNLLKPLRAYVLNLARLVEKSTWGGHLTPEMNILATITNCTIELMTRSTATSSTANRDRQACLVVQVHDPGEKGAESMFTRSALYLPITTALPSWDNRCSQVSPEGDTSKGWFEGTRVLRLTLNHSHYDAITSRCVSPICPQRHEEDLPLCFRNTYAHMLTEPYSSLSDSELRKHNEISEMIEKWKGSASVSEERGISADSLLDTPAGQLKLSDISRLQLADNREANPSLSMMSDDVASAYMSLLEQRHTRMREYAQENNVNPPPYTRYMHSWLFHSICRGLKRQNGKRKRESFDQYDQIVIPALIDRHWVLCVCCREKGIIGIYDPLGTCRKDVYEYVLLWTKQHLSLPPRMTWKFMQLMESRRSIQIGGIDCGIYMCKAAESYGLGIPLTISQWDIQYARDRMLLEFYTGKATVLKSYNFVK